jgi:UDP-N-acetylmuramoylalanine--D-glutamate ligase
MTSTDSRRPPRDKAYWRDRRVVVVGAGLSGIAAARLLHDCGAHVRVNDARDEADIADAARLREAGIELVAGGHPDDLWDDADCAVFSPGIRPDAPVTVAAAAAGVEIVAEIEVAGGLVQAPIIAITGSNGKSTVTSMLGAILAEAGLDAPVCGNIGTALCAAARREVVESLRPDGYVVEVSSFQAHGIDRFHPRLAAILNLQPDHIDWHGSMDAYAAAKLRLVRNMGAGDAIVFNGDDAEVARRLPRGAAERVPFAHAPDKVTAPAAWIGDGSIWWWPRDGERRALLRVDELRVIGPHNQANACAAAALATLFGVADEPIAEALRRYRPLEHRMEPCGEIGGVRCVNDSKATNVDATLAALSGFAAGVWLILGGRDKNADFGQLLPLLDRRVAAILLIGEASDAIAAALQPQRDVQRCETLERAVDHALASASAGDTLLLSPACTSFDQYPNFEERGRHFKRLIAARAAASGASERMMEAP